MPKTPPKKHGISVVENETLRTPKNASEMPISEKPDSPATPLSDNAPPLPSRDAGDRLSLKIDGGKFDVASLQARTVDKARSAFRKTIADPEFRKWAGIESDPGTRKTIVSPQAIGGAFDMVANIEIAVFTKKYQLPRETVERICSWSPKEHEYLDNQGAMLAEKYIPASWLQYADVALFAGALVTMIKLKMDLLEKLSRNAVEQIGAARIPETKSENTTATA